MCGGLKNANQLVLEAPATLSLVPQLPRPKDPTSVPEKPVLADGGVSIGASSAELPLCNIEETVQNETIYAIENAWNEVSEPAGAPTTLFGALWIALLVNHSFLPLFSKGDVRKRAAMRSTAALSAAISACLVTRVLSSDFVFCLFTVAVITWIVIEFEGILQYIVRRRMLARSLVSSFDPSDVVDSADVTIAAGLNDSTESGNSETLNETGPKLTADAVGEQLLEEYGRLAPTSEAVGRSVNREFVGTDHVIVPTLRYASEELAPSNSDRSRRIHTSAGRACRNGMSQSRGPMAKIPGDTVQLPSSSARPPSSQSERTHISGTGASSFSGATSSAKETKVTSTTLTHTTHTTASIISLSGPSMHLARNCDIDELRARYIQSITAKRENTEADQRLDCDDIMLMDDAWIITASDWSTPSLSLSCCMLVTASMTCFSLCIGLSQELVCSHCFGQIAWQTFGGWFIAIFVFNLFVVLVSSAMKFRRFQERLAARRDQQWKTLAVRRNLKSEAMRAVASTDSPANRANPSRSPMDKFDQHLAVLISGNSPTR